MNFDHKPKLLIVSIVLPFPGSSGQQQRVLHKLKALRENFHITFLTIAEKNHKVEIQHKLLEMCDEAIVLPSRYKVQCGSRISRNFHKVIGMFYILISGLKFSNYVIGKVEFSPARLIKMIKVMKFDGVIFEYWHAFKVARRLKQHGIYSILDMHDILWRSYARQLERKKFIPKGLKSWMVSRYKRREETAWGAFNALIAINYEEYNYVCRQVCDSVKMLYAPMGVDTQYWPFCRKPYIAPYRVAYYGGLGGRHNQQDALLCYQEIMPVIWEHFPDTELWIVGSNPPEFIKALENDQRVHVTGFLERPQEILKTAAFVLCPWSGTFGFRSRVVEVMALGVPVVASEDAVYGMGFDVGNGIFIDDSTPKMARTGLRLLQNKIELDRQGSLARQQIEEKFSFDATYGKLTNDLAVMIAQRRT